MICAACTEETGASPCAACGGEPLLFGRYRYEARLGTGTSGTTWRARDTEDGAPVAVKDVPLALATEQQVALVEREVRVLRQLDHPAIPRYIAHGLEGTRRSRRLLLVETFVDGEALRAPMSEADALGVMRELTQILGYLHGLRPPVIHRDIKPSNVLRRRDGRIVLIDFGSVRDSLPGTLAGNTVTGTFGYMAPEQFRGDATPATDWYGLGALGWWLMTGVEPRTRMGDTAADFHWQDGLQASPAMVALLGALLAPEPADRPADAAAVRGLIDGARSPVPFGGLWLSLVEDARSFAASTGRRRASRRTAGTDVAVLAGLQLLWLVPAVAVLLWGW